MEGVLPIVAAVLTTVGAIAGGVFTTRRLARYGLTTEQLRVNQTLRELAEVEEQKRKIVEGERDAALAKLATTQHDFDDCSRQRDDAYSELRLLRRRRTGAE